MDSGPGLIVKERDYHTEDQGLNIIHNKLTKYEFFLRNHFN